MRFLIAALFYIIIHSTGAACSTPVFQYAIERWAPDPFVIRIIHNNDLSETEKNLIKQLNDNLLTFQESDPYALEIIDTRKPIDDSIKELVAAHAKSEHAVMTIQFPVYEGNTLPFFSERLNENNKQTALDSAKRKELYTRLTNGHSFVWLLIESGDATKDKAAEKLLQDTIKEYIPTLQSEINERLQGTDFEDTGEELDDGTLDLSTPKVHSSIITLSKTDKRESLLLNMLTRMDDELLLSSEPIAIPVFGQGRALWPLMGKGINKDLITESMAFLSGSCSCQIKDQNPGYDIFLNVDWSTALENRTVGHIETPELIGPSIDPSDAPPLTVEEPKLHNLNPVNEEVISDSSTTPLLYGFIATIILILLAGLFILNKREQ